MKNLLIALAVFVTLACNVQADWRIVVVVQPNPSDQLIATYDIKEGPVGGPYTVVATLEAAAEMFTVITKTPGSGPFGYVLVAINVLDEISPDGVEVVATEPPPPQTIPSPSSPLGTTVIILGQ